MWWIGLFFIAGAFAQDELDLSSIKALGDSIPDERSLDITEEEISLQRHDRHFKHPKKIITIQKILESGTESGAINPGVSIVRLSDNKVFKLQAFLYVRFYKLEDEHSFKYLVNKDGTCTYRIASLYVAPVKEELALYETPLRYTPAPTNILRSDYDKKLTIRPEASFYAGIVRGDYMQDLFEDNKATSGLSTQYGAHFFTDWNLPVKAGAVFHYETTSYDLSGGGKINYSAFSFGPQFKTKEFDFYGSPYRFQAQFRVSPFARANAETQNGNVNYEFNSADLLASLEHPIRNRFGEFVLGAYMQSQWLNIKNAPQAVSLDATNETNKSFGVLFAQVFE